MATKPKPKAKPHHLVLSLPLDEVKVAAIQKCLKKGALTIKVASVDALKGARGAEGYIYD
jgi:hypothetical protein